MTWAHWLWIVIGLYALAGAAFSIWFLRRGIFAMDAGARGSHPAFFVMVLPGVIALWPVLWRASRRSNLLKREAAGEGP